MCSDNDPVSRSPHQFLTPHLFQEGLEVAEAFWDVQPISTHHFTQRISTLEIKVFNEPQDGGLRSRLSALLYVDGCNHGVTWEKMYLRNGNVVTK